MADDVVSDQAPPAQAAPEKTYSRRQALVAGALGAGLHITGQYPQNHKPPPADFLPAEGETLEDAIHDMAEEMKRVWRSIGYFGVPKFLGGINIALVLPDDKQPGSCHVINRNHPEKKYEMKAPLKLIRACRSYKKSYPDAPVADLYSHIAKELINEMPFKWSQETKDAYTGALAVILKTPIENSCSLLDSHDRLMQTARPETSLTEGYIATHKIPILWDNQFIIQWSIDHSIQPKLYTQTLKTIAPSTQNSR